MGIFSSRHEGTIKNKLREIPFTKPTERDVEFLAYQTNLSREEVVNILQNHLAQHPDGKMNRRGFLELYNTLRRTDVEIGESLSANIFRTLGVEDSETELITLKEFLLIFALTNKGDLAKKLEYAFDCYDINQDQALESEEVKDVVYSFLELVRPPRESQSSMDIATDCFKKMSVVQIVRKG